MIAGCPRSRIFDPAVRNRLDPYAGALSGQLSALHNYYLSAGGCHISIDGKDWRNFSGAEVTLSEAESIEVVASLL